MPRIVTEETKRQIRELYLDKPISIIELSKRFQLCQPTIMKIIRDLPKYNKSQIYNPDFNEHFFHEIDNEYKAYYLGLMIADGNVFKKENGGLASISITLDVNDEYLLRKFLEILQSNRRVGHDGRGAGQAAVKSDIMAQDLAQYGVIPRKTFTAYLPLIKDSLMRHLIRGIVDGDGSIQSKMNVKTNKHKHDISICGTHELMENISDYIHEHLDFESHRQIYDYKNRSLSEMKVSNIHDMNVFGKWLYDDAEIFMKRKESKFREFQKHYQLN